MESCPKPTAVKGGSTEPSIQPQPTAKALESTQKSQSTKYLNTKPGLKAVWVQALLFVLALCLFATIITFVEATPSAESASNRKEKLSAFLKINVSSTLTIIRTSQGILSALMTMILNESFSLLQWMNMYASEGLAYHDFLAMSPTTGMKGVLSLIGSSSTKAPAKLWALLRTTQIALLWVSGIALFFNTSIITVYDTAHAYSAIAGVGPFNASLVQPFIDFLQSLTPEYPYQVFPYQYFAPVYTLVANSLLSTVVDAVNCNGTGCTSYLLTGGLEMVTPWAPDGYDNHPMVKISNATSIQVDFEEMVQEAFSELDCDVFGQDGTPIGIRVCVKEAVTPGSLAAGLFICPNGTSDNACDIPFGLPNMTTTMTTYTRQANVLAARSNYSIASISDLTPPVRFGKIDVPEYRNALRWLLNYTAADIPAISSIAQSFWFSQDQMSNASTQGMLLQNFQSVLIFPSWFFSSNNWGNLDLESREMINTLPPEFYTEVSVVKPFEKLKFSLAMFIVYSIIQGALLCFVLGVLVQVGVGTRAPLRTSSFLLFDFASRTDIESQALKEGWSSDKDSEILAATQAARVSTKLGCAHL